MTNTSAQPETPLKGFVKHTYVIYKFNKGCEVSQYMKGRHIQIYDSLLSEQHYEVFHVHTERIIANLEFIHNPFTPKITGIKILRFSHSKFQDISRRCLSCFKMKMNTNISPLPPKQMEGGEEETRKIYLL